MKTNRFKKGTLEHFSLYQSLSNILRKKGFEIANTQGEDLDKNTNTLKAYKVDAVTAFEIFEHLLNPFNILKVLPTDRWFAGMKQDR